MTTPQQKQIQDQVFIKMFITCRQMETILCQSIKRRCAGWLILREANDLRQKCEVPLPSTQSLYILGHGNPGPGHYDEKPVSMSNKGSYFISKLKNSGCNFFNKQKRSMGRKPNPSPGPGSYRMPSDFGYYESNKPTKWKRIRIQSAPAWKVRRMSGTTRRSSKSTKRSRGRGGRGRGKRVKSRPRTST